MSGENKLIDECVHRLAEVFKDKVVSLPPEAFPAMLQALLNGQGLIIDTHNTDITFIKGADLFDDRSEPQKIYKRKNNE